MVTFRKNLMDKILQSSEVNSIEPIIHNPLKQLIENGTHMHYVSRFIQRFEEELNFEILEPHSEKERNNLKEALRVIQGIRVKHLSVNK